MSLSTLATLGITLTGRIVVTAGEIYKPWQPAQDRAVCTSVAQAYVTAPLPLFTSPSISSWTGQRFHLCWIFFFFTQVTRCQDIQQYRICVILSLKLLPKALTCALCVIFINRNERGALAAVKIATDSLELFFFIICAKQASAPPTWLYPLILTPLIRNP